MSSELASAGLLTERAAGGVLSAEPASERTTAHAASNMLGSRGAAELERLDPEVPDPTAEMPRTTALSTKTASEPEPEATEMAAGEVVVGGVAPDAIARALG